MRRTSGRSNSQPWVGKTLFLNWKTNARWASWIRHLNTLQLITLRSTGPHKERMISFTIWPAFLMLLVMPHMIHGENAHVDLDDYQCTGLPNLRSRLESWSHSSRCRELIGNARDWVDGDGSTARTTFKKPTNRRWRSPMACCMCERLLQTHLSCVSTIYSLLARGRRSLTETKRIRVVFPKQISLLLQTTTFFPA